MIYELDEIIPRFVWINGQLAGEHRIFDFVNNGTQRLWVKKNYSGKFYLPFNYKIYT